jgi:hypothetical protein
VVADYYDLALPADLASGAYHLSVSVGTPFAEESLSDAAGRTWFSLMTLHIQKPLRWARPGLDVSLSRAFGGGVVLTGVDAPRKVVPGETVSVALQWLVCGSTDYASRPRLILIGRDGTGQIVEPVSDAPGDWLPGALVVDRYTYTVPDGFVRAVVRGRDPWGWGASTYRLSMRIANVPPPVANFGGLIRLQSYAYERDTLSPGETVHLDLQWEAVRPVDEPYKVFVHVLGQNGLPVAQQDQEPVNGTYPTDRWRPGERIVDPYAIVLPGSLAPGEYQVEVGLYRISDLQRLPVVDPSQATIDDKVLLLPLTIR